MPIISKSRRKLLMDELIVRYEKLAYYLDGQELEKNTDGLKTGAWKNPEHICRTKGSELEIRMAVEDFKTVLAEVRRIK